MLERLDTVPGEPAMLTVTCANPLCSDRSRLRTADDGAQRLECPACRQRYDLLVRTHPLHADQQISVVFLTLVKEPRRCLAAASSDDRGKGQQ